MKRLLTAFATVGLLAWAGSAQAGPQMVAIGFMHSTADLATNGGGFNSAFDHSELGGKVEYWNMLREHEALNLQANIGFFSETEKPGTGASPGAPEGKYTQSSWSVRLGCDRVYSPLENMKVFIGPGLEFWSGKAKFEDVGGITGTYETESVNRFSLHGRIGSMMMIGESWGLTGQLGHRLGMASYEEKGAKTTWWPSSFDGAMGLLFSFGGK